MQPPTPPPRTSGAARAVEQSLARHRDQYRDEVRRLLDAALDVMRDQATADPTVNDILTTAGLSTSVFYRHFATKGDLLVALLDQAHELTAAHLEQRLSTVDAPRDRIAVWVRAMFDLIRSDAALRQNRALLLAHPRLLQEFPNEITTGFAVLAWPLQVAIVAARAEARMPPGDAAMDARLALNQVFGILIDAAALDTPPSKAMIDAVVAYTDRAVLGRAPTAEPATVRRARTRRPNRPA